MTSGANQGNSAEKNRGKQLRRSSKRPAGSTEGTQAKQLKRGSEEVMDDEASGSSSGMAEHNLVSNFNQENSRVSGNDRVKKRLVIKNFTLRNNTVGQDESEQIDIDNPEGAVGKDWMVLRDNVDAILEDRKTTTTMETLFAKVRAVCDKNLSKALYDRLIKTIVQYANLLKSTLSNEETMSLMEDNCEQYLEKFGKIWDAYPVKINLIRNVFLYLDRITLSGGDNEMLPLWDVSMQIYQKTFFPEIRKEFKSIKLFTALYMAMNRIMQKYTIDSPLKKLVEMLQTVHAGEEFANYLISQLRDHYNKERIAKLPSMTCNEYMEYAEDQISRYSQIVKINFDEPSALKDLQSTVLNCLVQQAIPQVLTQDFDKLLDSGLVGDISRMFSLCRQCSGGEEEVRLQFSNYMKQRGDKIIATYPDDLLVAELLSFKKKVDKIMNGAFKTAADPTKMRQTLSDAFETFVNKDVDKAAELISKHFHGLLHSGNKIITDDTSLDQMVDDAIVLFRYLRGKDVFEAYYKRGLAKRLFLERSASVDAEKMVLCKLKTECGAGFTYKLEGMFRDMEASDNYQTLFVQYLDHANREKTNFTVRVITGEYWPTYNPYEINIPKEMRATLDDYEEFYRSQHGNRNVKWHHALGTAVVSGRFKSGVKKELVATMYQAVIMLLFNKCDIWTVDEIVECTKIEQMEVVKNVLALLGGRDKPRILMKVDDGSDKKESTVESVKLDKFTVNSSFTDKRCRVRIAQVNIKTVVEEKKDIDNEVNQDRQYQIDACVVRIMKARKELSHTVLMNEVVQQLKFPVKAADIKIRLESLIEREYIARDADDSAMYRYVA